MPRHIKRNFLVGKRAVMNIVPDSSKPSQPQSTDRGFSLSESLEQLARASQKLADLLTDAAGDNNTSSEARTSPSRHLDIAKETLNKIFDKQCIDGYDGSEEMEGVRVAHLNAAIEMFEIITEKNSSAVPLEFDNCQDVASAIGHALLRELTDLYQFTKPGADRTMFTTEQRTALESAFLLKPRLNTAEKRALATACNLNPRQVEVWVISDM